MVAGADGRCPIVTTGGEPGQLRQLMPELSDAGGGNEDREADSSPGPGGGGSERSSTREQSTAFSLSFFGPCSVLAPATAVSVNPFDSDIVAIGREDGSVSVYDLGSGSAFPLCTWDAVAPTLSTSGKKQSDKANAAALFRAISGLQWSTVRPGGLFAVGDSGTVAAFDFSVDPHGPLVRECVADFARGYFAPSSGAGAGGKSKSQDAPRAVDLVLNGGGGRPAGRLYLSVLFASARGLRGAVGGAAIDATDGSPSAVAVLELSGGWSMPDIGADGRPMPWRDSVLALRTNLGAIADSSV